MDQIGDTLPNKAIAAGDKINSPPFTLEFFGGTHATIHPSLPPVANLGVMINETVYYPGDSFTNPEKSVKVLALPVTAPWMRIAEAMDYVGDIKAHIVFPTHDAVASETGKQLADKMIPSFVESYGGSYQRLTSSLEIDG